jgi:Thioredoxin
MDVRLLEIRALLLTQVDVDVNSDAAEQYNIEAMPTFKYFKVRSCICLTPCTHNFCHR